MTQMYKATVASFQAQREEALAVLQLYFTSSVAVGDHPTHLQDIKTWVSKLAEAEDALACIEKNFAVETVPVVANGNPVASDDNS